MYKVRTFHFGFIERFANVPRMKINCTVVIIGGLLFFSGWWILIDLSAVHPHVLHNKRVYTMPGVFSTLAMLVVNMVPLHVLRNPYLSDDKCKILMATFILFIGLVTAFGSLIGASYILIHDYLVVASENVWPGFAVFLQNLFIFISNLLIKFGTRRDGF